MPTTSRRPHGRFRLAAAAILLAGAVTLAGSLTANAQPSHPAPAAKKPTIVLVHGAFADPSSWDGEVTRLQHRGYSVRAIVNPVRDLPGDSDTIATFVRSIKGPVVLVAHSYGGAVISDASAHLKNVKALVYVDSLAPAIGDDSATINGKTSATVTLPEDQIFTKLPYAGAPAEASLLYFRFSFYNRYFGSDLPTATNRKLWATQTASSSAALGFTVRAEGWRHIPSWFFISTGDKIITEQAKLMMAKRAHSHVTLFKGGSHLSLISHPEAVTRTILAAARSVH